MTSLLRKLERTLKMLQTWQMSMKSRPKKFLIVWQIRYRISTLLI
eukprot:UN08146